MSDKCRINAKIHALNQHANYDEKNNEILYGNSSLLNVTGVSDGTCNQINPLMLRYTGRCSVGTAGGNPCNLSKIKDSVEGFGHVSGCNINGFVTGLFLIIVLILFITIVYKVRNVNIDVP